MGIACLGISYKTATVQVREKCAFSGSARDSVLSGFAAGKFQSLSGLTELVLISTCNRVELYAVGNESLIESRSIHDALHSFLTEWHRLEAGELQPCLVSLSDESAVRHLCTVAAGLDSMVLGEAEILGQVGGALEASMRNGAIGPVLTTMFRTAIRVGRRIRSETSFGRNPASVSSVAVHLAEQIRQETGGRKVLLVGAGKMGSRAAEVLKGRGDWEIVVASRTLERAADVAQSRAGGCEALSLESLQDAIAAADIVITSTGAPHLIVTRDMVQKAVASRGGRSLAFIDVALPRDVEETVRLVPGVRVFDIDDLKGLVKTLVSEQRKEIPHAEAIMREEMDDFAEWLNGRALAPVLTGLRRHAEDIRQRELARTMRYLADLDPEAREHIERFSRSLVSKLLHEPTQYLRSQAGQGQSSEYMDMARRLFGLTVSGGAAGPEQAATPTELS